MPPADKPSINGHYIMSKAQFWTTTILFLLTLLGAAYAWGSSYTVVKERQGYMEGNIVELQARDKEFEEADKKVAACLGTIIVNQQIIARELGIDLPRH